MPIARAISELRRMYPPTPSEPFGKALIGLVVGTLILALLFYLLAAFPRTAPSASPPQGDRSGRDLLVLRFLRQPTVGHRSGAGRGILRLLVASRDACDSPALAAAQSPPQLGAPGLAGVGALPSARKRLEQLVALLPLIAIYPIFLHSNVRWSWLAGLCLLQPGLASPASLGR